MTDHQRQPSKKSLNPRWGSHTRSTALCTSTSPAVMSLGRSVNKSCALLLLLLVTMCSCSDKDQATEALADARRLAAEGKFEQALEKHVWFHNHALEIKRSYYGVRLSFALSDWLELGKKYPKALETLKGIRDEKTSRLLAGEQNRELFHDVDSINDHLGESKTTVDLFKKLEAKQPEFAASIYDLADEAIVSAQEYDLARKYLGDPGSRLTNAKRQFEEGLEFANKRQNDDVSRKAFERIFADEVVRIITVLDKTGDSVKAREIQSKALDVLESPAIRDAIKK